MSNVHFLNGNDIQTVGHISLNQFYWLLLSKTWLFSLKKQFHWTSGKTQHTQYKLQTDSTRNIYIYIDSLQHLNKKREHLQ